MEISDELMLQLLQNSILGDKMSTEMKSQLFMQIEVMRKTQIAKEYDSKITQLKNGIYIGQYQTHISKNGNRKTIRAKSKDELYVKIAKELDESGKHTFEDCYKGWLQRVSISIQPSTIYKYQKDYKRFFYNVKGEYVEDWSINQIKIFVETQIRDQKLTKKGFGALKTVLLGIYHFALDEYGYNVHIDDVVKDITRNHSRGKGLEKSAITQKTREELIFVEDEVKAIIEFCRESNKLVDKGILLDFESGMRVGELAALTKDDILDDLRSIKISKTEERIGSKAEYQIVDSAKTEAGNRIVVLPLNSVIKEILEMSSKDSPYLFSDLEFYRYSSKKFRDRLYTICNKLGITKRAPHAIRRTYATMLVEKGVPEKTIIKQLGHTDFKVTDQFYNWESDNIEGRKQDLDAIF